MQVEQRVPIVKVMRRCVRCGIWRSLGNFLSQPGVRSGGRTYNGRTCRQCYARGVVVSSKRSPWTITDLGRSALRELERKAS